MSHRFLWKDKAISHQAKGGEVKKQAKKRRQRTLRGRVKRILGVLWLKSDERAWALKRDGYTCQGCDRKQSKAKGKEFQVQVHHKDGINWDGVVDIIIERILVNSDKLVTLCKECHKKKHEKIGIEYHIGADYSKGVVPLNNKPEKHG